MGQAPLYPKVPLQHPVHQRNLTAGHLGGRVPDPQFTSPFRIYPGQELFV